MLLFKIIISGFAIAAAQQVTAGQEQLEGTPTQQPPQITPGPSVVRRANSTSSLPPGVYVYSTSALGSYSFISKPGSFCGYVTSNIHWPVYCGESEYCFSEGPNIECCSTTSTSYFTSTQVNTGTETERNTATTTVVSTYLGTGYYNIHGINCTTLAPQTCYNYNQTASCTGDCTNTAAVCTDPNFPACASLYSTTGSGTTIGTAYSYVSLQAGVLYNCDTAAYGLEWDTIGYWPDTLSPYTTTYSGYTYTSAPTFTPTPIPFSNSQASRAASGAQAALTAQTTSTTSGAERQIPPGLISLLVLGLALLCLH